jgi:3-hydroxybutyryl-CoA dehydrogenase
MGWLAADTDEIGRRTRPTLEIAGSLASSVADSDLVFENIFEDAHLKRALYRQVEDMDGGTKLLGSNASSLPWTILADGMRWPERFFLMNFSGPRTSRLAEYMEGPQTGAVAREAALAWGRRIGVVPIPVLKDTPGYVQNRIWRAIKKEALRLVDQGYSTPDDIDRGFILSYGVRQGPFMIMDRVGLHTILRIEERYHEMTGDESDRPPRVLVDLVESGRLGTDAGGGFYDYPNPRFEQDGWLDGKT